MSSTESVAPICYIEIPAPDVEKAKAFYGDVFAWTFQEMNPTYWFFEAGKIGGALDRDMTPASGGTVLYLEVDDIDTRLNAITAAGGALVKPRTEIGGGYGFYAHFTDPNGNRLGLWQKESGD